MLPVPFCRASNAHHRSAESTAARCSAQAAVKKFLSSRWAARYFMAAEQGLHRKGQILNTRIEFIDGGDSQIPEAMIMTKPAARPIFDVGTHPPKLD